MENDQEVIYVSDERTSRLTKLTMKGQVLLTYNGTDCEGFNGIIPTAEGH